MDKGTKLFVFNGCTVPLAAAPKITKVAQTPASPVTATVGAINFGLGASLL